MLLSHEYRFIFIKTKKTAGTSIEIALSQHLRDPRDIITPISAEDEIQRQALGIVPKNYLECLASSQCALRNNKLFWNHITASEIQQRLPAAMWDQCVKISSERHPYEKAVSQAWYRYIRQPQRIDFPMFLDQVVTLGKYENFHRYSIGGKVIAEQIIRYEHALEDVNALLKHFGLSPLTALPSAKTRFGADKRPVTEILSTAQKRKIQQVCAAEFDYFGYAY